MNTVEEQLDYQRIKTAIEYISENHLEQPSLSEMAAKVGLSPFHFQRLFTRWAGVSPKKFLQFTTLTYARQLLQQEQATLFDVAINSGLSGTGRLHDLFINFESLTPGEYKSGGSLLQIKFKHLPSIFGDVLIARTDRGICHLSFINNAGRGLQELKEKFPQAFIEEGDHPSFNEAIELFTKGSPSNPLQLHLKGTPFQIKVWEALLKIPEGTVTTYGSLAKKIGMASSSRAVGTAIGSNPVAVLIPCHRVIQSTGLPGGYHWGLSRKKIILAREAAITEARENDAVNSVNSPGNKNQGLLF